MQEEIKIIQNILKQDNQFDLAIKLENAYYEYMDEGYHNEVYGVYLYVNPKYFLELDNMASEIKDKLLRLFAALIKIDYPLTTLKFHLDASIRSEDITNTTYIFVDESGDMNFTQTGSKHYMFNFLVKKRPFKLHEYISNYRYELLEKNLDPLIGRRLNIEYFHAHNDNKHIKNALFELISTFDEESVKVYSYILEKVKVQPQKRKIKEDFYIDNLIYSIAKLLEKLEINNNFIIITDNLPVTQNRKKQEKALKMGVAKYLEENNIHIRYDIFHHCSASSANLQIIDYIGWAIYRKYEKKDDSYYQKIKRYILEEDIVTKNRGKKYYGE